LDFAPDNYADAAFPTFVHPDADKLRWQTEDWDPSLRFWALGFDPHLGEWLKTEDISQRSIMAAREFAYEYKKWQWTEQELLDRGWLDKDAHLAWRYGKGASSAWDKIKEEIDQLFVLMEDDRDRYLAEINAQADGLAAYVISFLGMDSERRPHTIELIRCGLAMGNIFYFYYKQLFRRVRASTICPGLVPPFGPPRHPSFPSGHSFLGHFIALLLLEIPDIAVLYGDDLGAGKGEKPPLDKVMSQNYVFNGPLLWLGDRLGRNRERAGLHYPSDSNASRWFAGAVAALLTTPKGSAAQATPPGAANPVTDDALIDCPSLQSVLKQSKAEWAA